jgi:hypothetical protein
MNHTFFILIPLFLAVGALIIISFVYKKTSKDILSVDCTSLHFKIGERNQASIQIQSNIRWKIIIVPFSASSWIQTNIQRGRNCAIVIVNASPTSLTLRQRAIISIVPVGNYELVPIAITVLQESQVLTPIG